MWRTVHWGRRTVRCLLRTVDVDLSGAGFQLETRGSQGAVLNLDGEEGPVTMDRMN